MVDSRLAGIRIAFGTAACLALLACIAPRAASAEDCPGHPEALGTSRTLVVDPHEHPRIGVMQYSQTLPLRDHEVVLTFDDGPLPKNSNQILRILADQCIKATFFNIGEQALANPEGVRKYVAAGHSIGSHSQHHPLTFNKMSVEQAKQEIDAGIASITAALGDPAQLSPFFRIPGLLRADAAEEYAASQGLMVWSADFVADDWRHISSSRVFDLAIKRLEARGRGILLLHDIQARTVAALPRILHELKVRGYHIVHVVAATSEQPATPTEPEQWLSHPSAAAVAALRWPKIPAFAIAEVAPLPAPALANFNSPDGTLLLLPEPFDLAKQGVAAREAPWPHLAARSPTDALTMLPAPAASLFAIPDEAEVLRPPLPLSHHAEPTIPAAPDAAGETPRRARPATRHIAGARGHVRPGSHPTPRFTDHARRSVRVASLRKR
jgi:peptidoglycan/xylan/chitin deacetylase (PgdA/CDA1 family)